MATAQLELVSAQQALDKLNRTSSWPELKHSRHLLTHKMSAPKLPKNGRNSIWILIKMTLLTRRPMLSLSKLISKMPRRNLINMPIWMKTTQSERMPRMILKKPRKITMNPSEKWRNWSTSGMDYRQLLIAHWRRGRSKTNP